MGYSLVELIIERSMKTKILDLRKQTRDKVQQANKKQKYTQKKRKEDYNNRTKVRLVTVKSWNKVLLSQNKCSVDLPCDQGSYGVDPKGRYS